MAVPRASSVLMRRVASVPFTQRCPQCLCPFSTNTPFRVGARRPMGTATAYNTSSLETEAPPPRNFGVPDTSIAGGATKEEQQKKASIPETEAQKPTSKPSPRPRRFNFGPRKATIKLTPTAVSHLRELLDQPEPKLIRIGTKAKGCSGLAYHLEYVDKPSKLDEQVEQDGVKVLIDNKALLNIIGSEMDWLEDKLNQRFIFKNPNITDQCGCGESFSVS